MFSSKEVASFWDKVARDHQLDPAGAGMLGPQNAFAIILRAREEERHFAEIVKLRPDMNVLEVGTGGGRWSFFLAKHVHRVTGIDISSEMINLAEKERQARNLTNIKFETRDLLSLPDKAEYDLIYFSSMLQYLSDEELAAALDKANKLLKTGGVIISRDTVQLAQRVIKSGDYPVIYRNADEYKDAFQPAGFSCTYVARSYKDRQFVGPVSFLYNCLKLPFSLTRSILIGLNKINDLLGQPRFLKSQARKNLESSENPQMHCFFRYERY